MSKKKFTEGLETLFSDLEQDSFSGQHALLKTTGKDRAAAASEKEAGGEAEKKSSGKRFSDDLESFLHSAFEDSFERQMRREPAPAEEAAIKKRTHRPVSGLDTLIRNTVDLKQINYEELPTRRLTIVFDTQKLHKLKEIARLEKTILRDIIDDIVAQYIESYEKRKKK